MWIKICANTNLEDAKLAAELGADAVGFVFAESARQVTPAQVAEIVPRLPDAVEKIGVFSSRDAEEIAGIVRQTGLTGVQLHGGFDLDLARRLKAHFAGNVAGASVAGRRVIITQVLHWPVAEDPGNAAEIAKEIAARLKAIAREPAVNRVLLDAKTKNASGGTGQSFDWVAARTALRAASGLKLIAAGGLNPGNVLRAIEELEPWGVDVASGVEASRGRKHPQKLKDFIAAVRGL